MVGNNIFPLKKERCQQIQTVSNCFKIRSCQPTLLHKLSGFLYKKKLNLSNPLTVLLFAFKIFE